MNYPYTAYLFLSAAARAETLSDAFVGWAAALPVLPDEALTNATLSALTAGGFITLSDEGRADELTRLSLTPAGKPAVTLPLARRLFGKASALRAQEDAFCALTLPDDVPPVTLGMGAFKALTAKFEAQYETVKNPFTVLLTSDDRTITVRELDEDGHTPDEEQTTSLPSSESVDSSADDAPDDPPRPSLAALCGGEDTDEYIRPGILTVTSADSTNAEGLIGAVYDLLTGPQKTRKTCLSGPEGGFVLSFSPDAGGVRVTASPIRFNKQRFKGKRDSDLDYAQCGDAVLDCILSRDLIGGALTLACAASAHALSDEARGRLAALRRATR